jgi:hypothetical protein
MTQRGNPIRHKRDRYAATIRRDEEREEDGIVLVGLEIAGHDGLVTDEDGNVLDAFRNGDMVDYNKIEYSIKESRGGATMYAIGHGKPQKPGDGGPYGDKTLASYQMKFELPEVELRQILPEEEKNKRVLQGVNFWAAPQGHKIGTALRQIFFRFLHDAGFEYYIATRPSALAKGYNIKQGYLYYKEDGTLTTNPKEAYLSPTDAMYMRLDFDQYVEKNVVFED